MSESSALSSSQSMRILSIDPGGEKMGWAVLDPGPTYVGSGVLRWPREGQPYQPYRMYLTKQVRFEVALLIGLFEPEKIVCEIVPAIGGEGFMKSGQGYIANVVATTVHNVAMGCHIPVEQVGARSWEAKIAKRKIKSEKISKAKIRNGVLVHLPELKEDLSKYLNEWDRWDALGIGLFTLGFVTELG